MVSSDSTFLVGSYTTRLLKHGMDGHTVELVCVSWIAKPCGRSSRWGMFRVPPALGVWLMAGGPSTTTSMRLTAGRDIGARMGGMRFLLQWVGGWGAAELT